MEHVDGDHDYKITYQVNSIPLDSLRESRYLRHILTNEKTPKFRTQLTRHGLRWKRCSQIVRLDSRTELKSRNQRRIADWPRQCSRARWARLKKEAKFSLVDNVPENGPGWISSHWRWRGEQTQLQIQPGRYSPDPVRPNQCKYFLKPNTSITSVLSLYLFQF